MRNEQRNLQNEMISRSSKHILSRLIKTANAYDHAYIIAHFFNCLLGTNVESNPVPALADLPADVSSDRSWASLTPDSLRSQIITETETRYRYTLPAAAVVITQHTKLLREICLRVGIQLHLRSYDFGSALTPVTEIDGSTVVAKEENKEEVQKSADLVQKKKKVKTIAKSSIAKVDDNKVTFHAEDVLNIMPVVKSNQFKVRSTSAPALSNDES